MTTDEILDILEEMFPDAHCELEHRNAFELLVAVGALYSEPQQITAGIL